MGGRLAAQSNVSSMFFGKVSLSKLLSPWRIVLASASSNLVSFFRARVNRCWTTEVPRFVASLMASKISAISPPGVACFPRREAYPLDDVENIIEVMSNAAREHANAFHLLRLKKLFFELLSLLLGLSTLGDIIDRQKYQADGAALLIGDPTRV